LGIGIFRRSYTVRRHAEQEISGGYASAKYSDDKMMLNVQPMSNKELLALPEGNKAVKGVKAYGGKMLAPANENGGIPGDRLYYLGQWYVCVSSARWDHTPLMHYRSQFTLLPASEQGKPPEGVSWQ